LSEQHFLDLIGATSFFPGPNSTEMAIHINREKGGWKRLLVAGVCFIMSAVLITGVFAYFYKKYGINPVIIAIILAAIYPLAKKSIKITQLLIIAVAALALSLLKYNEIYILFGAGFLTSLYSKFKSSQKFSLIPLTVVQIAKTTLVTATNWNLFLIFLKIGSILYGGAMFFLPFLALN
jgi:chromate transporter